LLIGGKKRRGGHRQQIKQRRQLEKGERFFAEKKKGRTNFSIRVEKGALRFSAWEKKKFLIETMRRRGRGGKQKVVRKGRKPKASCRKGKERGSVLPQNAERGKKRRLPPANA